MATLIAAGDSFTWGSDLKDSNGKVYSNHTWSALTAKYLNADYQCVALPGGSNNSIARRCIHQIENKVKHIDDKIVMVMWTFPARLEIKTKIKDPDFNLDTFSTIGFWNSLPFEEKLKIFKKERHEFFRIQHEQYENMGIISLSQDYQKFVSDEYFLYETTKSIILLKNYLELNNIKYYFLKTSNVPIKTVDPYILTFKTMMEQSNWLVAPPFLEWAKENNFEIGDGQHPLEPAHAAYFEEFIKPIMNDGF
jgi:hypothetical protein